jgi:transposase
MARFPSPAKLAAWAGLAPGDNESAGKRKKAAARNGNQHLRVAMVEAAWAVSRTATRPGVRFRRLACRFGRLNLNKAAVAVAHTLLSIAWAVMTHDADYTDAGADYYDRRPAQPRAPRPPPPARPHPARLPGNAHRIRRRAPTQHSVPSPA